MTGLYYEADEINWVTYRPVIRILYVGVYDKWNVRKGSGAWGWGLRMYHEHRIKLTTRSERLVLNSFTGWCQTPGTKNDRTKSQSFTAYHTA